MFQTLRLPKYIFYIDIKKSGCAYPYGYKKINLSIEISCVILMRYIARIVHRDKIVIALLFKLLVMMRIAVC